ncbi:MULTISPECIES: VC0807 family protein [unclassified Nonomuraea]|uniref:VC0807 family protein n=1 Tax=unclassified Nonomuraea TaxID=2593643 RepID=UPI00340587D7
MNRSMIKVVLSDVLPSVAAYYLLRALHVGEYAALLSAAVVGFLRTVYVAVRERRLDGFAAFMCLLFGLGLVLSFVTGDERFMLAVKSITTGVIAAVLITTCAVHRPAAFSLAKRFGAEDAATAARWDALYVAEPAFRRIYYVMTLTWAAAFLAESAVRLPLIYLLPVDVMAGLSTALLLGTIALIAAWSAWYGKRGEAAVSISPSQRN